MPEKTCVRRKKIKSREKNNPLRYDHEEIIILTPSKIGSVFFKSSAQVNFTDPTSSVVVVGNIRITCFGVKVQYKNMGPSGIISN